MAALSCRDLQVVHESCQLAHVADPFALRCMVSLKEFTHMAKKDIWLVLRNWWQMERICKSGDVVA